ncbi:MAG: acyl carrier protein [Pirellulales bacterium]
MSVVAERLKACFQAAFPDVPAERLVELEAANHPAWDSMTMVVLVNLVQEEFGVEVPPEDVAELLSFASFRDYLASRVV